MQVADYHVFIKQAYDKRNSIFKNATTIELREHIAGHAHYTVSIRSEDRLNVQDILITDLGMEIEDADLIIGAR